MYPEEEQDNKVESGPHCPQCAQPVNEADRFCPHCGFLLQENGPALSIIDSPDFKSAIWFFLTEMFILLIAHASDLITHFSVLMVMDGLLALLTILFVIPIRKEIATLFSLRRLNIGLILILIPAAALASFCINSVVTALNLSIFHEDYEYLPFFSHLPYPRLMLIVCIALLPAIFEELAARGVLHTRLQKVMDPWLVSIIVGFMFAIQHLNLISLFWLFPFGWFLSWLRAKYHTLWYGMIVHFVFNLTVCLMELYGKN